MNKMGKKKFVLLGMLLLWTPIQILATNLKITSETDFKNLPEFFNLTPGPNGMAVDYNGKSSHSRDLVLQETYPLAEQKFIRFSVAFTKEKWDYSALFIPVLNFLDKNGKSIARYDADFGYLCASDFSTNWKLGERNVYHNDFRVPPNAVKLEVGFNCRGNPFRFVLHKVSVGENGRDQTKAFFKRPDYTHISPELSREEVLKELAGRKPLSVKTVRKEDSVIIRINGKDTEPVIFKNGPVEGSVPLQLKRDATFRKAGFKIFVVNVPFGQTRGRVRGPVWTEKNQYDIAQLENAVYDVLSNVPDAYVMIELHVNPYYEWGISNPDEIYCNPAGVKGLFTSRFVKYSNTPPKKNDVLIWQPSLHSEKFRKDTSAALEEVFNRFAHTPAAKALIGVYLNGGIDNQWFSPAHDNLDHSGAAVSAFRSFVREKYRSDLNALRAAWKDPSITFETIRIPESKDLRVPSFTYSNEKVPDYNRFLRQTGTDLFLSFASAVKRGSDGKILVGAYWPHGGLSSYPMSEHCNMEKLLQSDAVDFYSVVPDYYIPREPGQARSESVYNGSLKLHDKLLVTELDLRTAELRNWGMWGADYYMETHNAETFRQDLLSFIAWSRTLGGGFHAYDLTCGFWDTDKAIAAWTDGVRLFDFKAQSGMKNGRVAVFTEETTKFFYSQHPDFNTFQYGLREEPIRALRLAGLPFDVYLPCDLFHPELKNARILVFADAGFMTAAEAEKVRKIYGNSNRVLVWNHLPGIFSGDSPAAVCGFKIVPDSRADRRPLSVLDTEDTATKLLKGFNTNMSSLRPGIQYAVRDPEAKILAVYRDTDLGAMAVKRYPAHTEIWVGQAGAFSPQFYRNLATIADMTPVISTDEPSYIGNGLICIQASFSGLKEITLPGPFRNFVVFTGQQPVSNHENKVSFVMKAGETLVLLERLK